MFQDVPTDNGMISDDEFALVIDESVSANTKSRLAEQERENAKLKSDIERLRSEQLSWSSEKRGLMSIVEKFSTPADREKESIAEKEKQELAAEREKAIRAEKEKQELVAKYEKEMATLRAKLQEKSKQYDEQAVVLHQTLEQFTTFKK